MIHIDLTAKIGKFLDLSDPFWIASAHYSNSKSAINSWKEIKPAALTLKTAHFPQSSETTRQVRRKLSTVVPRFGRSLYTDGPKQAELLSFDAAHELAAYALKELPETKVGASVLASPENDYGVFAERVEGVAFCELNLKYAFRVKAERESYLDKGKNAFDDILVEITKFCDAFKDLPSGRGPSQLLSMIPGMNGGSGICTGGTCGYTLNAYSAHGGNTTEGRLQVDGMSAGAAIGGAGVSGYLVDAP